MTINFGIAGCGHIAAKHASALADMENARLAAVCDLDQKRTLPFVQRYNATPYIAYEDFLKHNPLDAVIICAPSGLHFQLGEKAALAGKHLLVEKPFVLNVADGKKLVDTCREKGLLLGVVHPNRTKPAVTALKNALRQELFGRITHVSAVLRWNRTPEYFSAAAWSGTKLLDGGILFNQAIHNIDLLNWLAGPVEEVFAYGATRIHSIECEDVCACALKFRGGALGLIEAAVTIYPRNLEESLAVFGSRGTAVLGGTVLSGVKEWKFADMTEDESRQQAEIINGTPNTPGHMVVLRDFISAINDNRPPMVSGEEALKTLCLIKAIYRSMETGRPAEVHYIEGCDRP